MNRRFNIPLYLAFLAVFAIGLLAYLAYGLNENVGFALQLMD